MSSSHFSNAMPALLDIETVRSRCSRPRPRTATRRSANQSVLTYSRQNVHIVADKPPQHGPLYSSDNSAPASRIDTPGDQRTQTPRYRPQSLKEDAKRPASAPAYVQYASRYRNASRRELASANSARRGRNPNPSSVPPDVTAIKCLKVCHSKFRQSKITKGHARAH